MQDENSVLKKKLGKAIQVIRHMEWARTSRFSGYAPAPACPSCGGFKAPGINMHPDIVGHAPDCPLASLLSDHPAPEPGVEAGEDQAAAKTAELERGLARELLTRFRDPENFIAPHFDDVERVTILTALERMATPANGGRDGK